MGLRHAFLASFSLVALVAAAGAQTPPKSVPPAPPVGAATRSPAAASAPVRGPAMSATQVAQAPAARAAGAAAHAGLTGTPRTLAEALAMTYSNQPALQAERAKLRATDVNAPTALAGWRPTVVMADSLGYGDGLSRQFLRI